MNPQDLARVKDIAKKLRRSDVYKAVGPELKEAMIAREMISLQRAQNAEDVLTIDRFNALYEAVCQDLLPEIWGSGA